MHLSIRVFQQCQQIHLIVYVAQGEITNIRVHNLTTYFSTTEATNGCIIGRNCSYLPAEKRFRK